MREDSKWVKKFRSALLQGIAAAEKVFSSREDAHKVGQDYVVQTQRIMKKADVEYERVERDVIRVLSNARRSLKEIKDIKTELQGLFLKCQMITGEIHEFCFRRIGMILFFQASFDNGYSACCEPVGPLVSKTDGAIVGAYVVELSADSGLSRPKDVSNKDFLYKLITAKMEWFLEEVGKRIPIYRLATSASEFRDEKRT